MKSNCQQQKELKMISLAIQKSNAEALGKTYAYRKALHAISFLALILATTGAAIADPDGNGIYRCPDGHDLIVSGYKGWGYHHGKGWDGSIKVTYHGKTHTLPNYYKFGFGKSPDSPDGYIDILYDSVEFKINGYSVCASYPRR